MNTTRTTLARSLPLLTALALLAGCAGTSDSACERHEERTRGTKPQTTYKLIAPKSGEAAVRTLPPGNVALAPTYRIQFKPPYSEQCRTITLYKDVVIQRSNDRDVEFSEVREFYAEDGTLITSYTQDITAQVPRSGKYVATTPLPIPKNAPPGRYKIVNKLLYERPTTGRSPVQIARAEGTFFIVPRR